MVHKFIYFIPFIYNYMEIIKNSYLFREELIVKLSEFLYLMS